MKEIFQYKPKNSQKIDLHLATISRSKALFCLDIHNTIELLLKKTGSGKRYSLVLAVSGGIDSIAMLGVFLSLQKKYPRDLCVAHFNHGIREESDKEEALVQEVCAYFNILCYTKKENIPVFAKENKLGLEEAARKKRYAFLEEIRLESQADYICIAHHAHDLAEDMLMRLCRGSVWPHLAGMPILCDNRKIIRPLLYYKKQELIDFVEELKLPYVNDLSNESQEFLRNRVRKQILPLFLKENPQFLESVYNLHMCARDDDDFFEEYMDTFWQNVTLKYFQQNSEAVNTKEAFSKEEYLDNLSKIQEISIPIRSLQDIPKAMRLRIYLKALILLQDTFAQNTTLKLLDNAVMQNSGKRIFKFTKKIRATIQKSTLVFYISN